MRLRALCSGWRLYTGWALLSAVGLAIACYIDPYVFAFSAFAAAWISGLLVLAAAVLSWRSLPWSILGAAPTAVSFWVLSGYNWA